MEKLKEMAAEYLELESRCDGKAETFKALHPLAQDLARRVKDFGHKVRSREAKYFAHKLYIDASDMEMRFWKYTVGYEGREEGTR